MQLLLKFPTASWSVAGALPTTPNSQAENDHYCVLSRLFGLEVVLGYIRECLSLLSIVWGAQLERLRWLGTLKWLRWGYVWSDMSVTLDSLFLESLVLEPTCVS